MVIKKKSRLENARNAFEKKDISATKLAHTKGAIKRHFHNEDTISEREKYVSEFIYGAVDGTVTTFAVVAGATGAALDPVVVIILGFANLIADGFSMACGNFLSEKTQIDYIKRERNREEWEIENAREGEVEEVREIYRKKGFKGKDLDRAVTIITSDKKTWLDTMMADELGLLESPKSPLLTAAATFVGFVTIGIIPLSAYLLATFVPFFSQNTFAIACLLTFFGLIIVGIIKSQVNRTSILRSTIETVFIGGAAAVLAYLVGYLLRFIVGV
ncbi:MAG: VIT1/CCC1 transporter family protein [Nanoarchaeota archaeon]